MSLGYSEVAGRELTGREQAGLLLAGILSLSAYTFGSALYAAVGIALFLAIWAMPVLVRPRLLVEALGYWPLWLLPALGLLSALWSRDPSGTLKSAVELAAFTLAVITLGRMLNTRLIVVSLVAALVAVALVSLASGQGNVGGGSFMLQGIFESKNALSLFCGVLAVAGLAGVLDRAMPASLRLFCLAGAVAGVGIGLASRSVGGTVATALALLTLVGAMALARVATRIRRLTMAAAVVVLGIVGAAIASFGRDRLADGLALLGKTPDLTGRIYLWLRAGDVITDHRWLGVGYQAFWRPQFADARGLYRYGGIASQRGFISTTSIWRRRWNWEWSASPWSASHWSPSRRRVCCAMIASPMRPRP